MNCDHEFTQYGDDESKWCKHCGALDIGADAPLLPKIAEPGWPATYRAISALWLGLPDMDCGSVDEKFCELLDAVWIRMNPTDRSTVQYTSCSGAEPPTVEELPTAVAEPVPTGETT